TTNGIITDPTFTPINEATDITLKPTLTMVFDAHTTAIIEENETIISIVDINNTSNKIELKTGGGIDTQDTRISFSGSTIAIDLSKGSESLVSNTNYAVYIKDNTIQVDGGLYYNQLENLTTWTFTTGEYRQWVGTTSDFNEPTNWLGNGTNYIITTSGLSPIVSEDIVTDIIIINAGASLTIPSGITLTVNASLTIESSTNSSIGNGNLLEEGILNSTGATINIEQNIERDLEGLYISSPVIGATQNNSNISSGMYRRNTSASGWEVHGTTEELEAGIGYLAYGYAHEVIKFNGVPNSSDVGPLPTINSADPINYGWNLVGNPFPCSIDWLDIITNNMDDEFQILNQDTEIYGVYNSGIGVNLNPDPDKLTHIPSCHSFWVQVAKEQTNGNITIPAEARVTSNYTYLKSASATQKTKIRFSGINESNIEDELLLSFNPDANDGDDVRDSEKRFSYNNKIIQLYTIHSNRKYVIDSYENYTDAKTIKLGYKTGIAGTYKIRLKEFVNDDEDITIQLEDLTNTDPAKTMNIDDEYSFTTAAGSFEERFLIHILPSGTTDMTNTDNDNLQINIHAFESYIYIKIPELTKPLYKIYSTTGKILQTGTLSAGFTNKVLSQNEGIVIVQIISDEKTTSQKVFIKK
ncbi:T9SS type A sorting domain-containing protein, partial [Labilibacter marinus]|uniref:T9SS type A sorting domain-containing protein n=1 Tax=Labilibacter marinus TaxID=1477105 RepID=UPI00082DBA26